MKGMVGWAWDSMNYAMWLNTAQQPRADTMVVFLFLDSRAAGIGVSTPRLDAKICKYASQQPLPSTTRLDHDDVTPLPVSGMVEAGCVFPVTGQCSRLASVSCNAFAFCSSFA